MTVMSVPACDRFSVITIADRASESPFWQSLLNWPEFGDAHVACAGGTNAQRNLWAARLDQAVLNAEKPVLLVAGGASCFATAWWARLSPASYVSRVAGALLFAPLNRRGTIDRDVASTFASPRIALPFPSAIIGEDALYRQPDAQVRALAESWGSRFVGGSVALDPPASASAWLQAQDLIMRLTARVVERDLRLAEALDLPLDSAER